jgi:CheY-like chemotaxis protein
MSGLPARKHDAEAASRDVPSTTRPRFVQGNAAATRRPMTHKIVIAESNPATRSWLLPLIGAIGARIHEAPDGAELERLLEEEGPFDLVITSSQLPEQSGLSVLARVRSRGSQTPFIVVTSVHESSLRIFVSDAEGTVLSSRVVDGDNLRNLALNLIEAGKKPR